MDDSDVGDYSDHWFRQSGQTRDVARTLHTHLEHQGRVVRLQAQDGQGNAGLGVEVALRPKHVEMTRKDGGHHLLRRGLAVAACNRNDQGLHPSQGVPGQRVQSVPRVRHQNLDHA